MDDADAVRVALADRNRVVLHDRVTRVLYLNLRAPQPAQQQDQDQQEVYLTQLLEVENMLLIKYLQLGQQSISIILERS